MKFKPLHDRVLVRRMGEEETSAGGIIIPDTAQEKPMEGEVVAVGTGARTEDGKLIAMDVKAGDRVLFGKWSGTEVRIDGEDLLVMKESDIMGVIEGTGAERLVEYDVTALRAERDPDGVGQGIDAVQQALTGVARKLHFFCSHSLETFPSVSVFCPGVRS